MMLMKYMMSVKADDHMFISRVCEQMKDLFLRN